MDEHFFIYNNKFYRGDQPVLGTADRSWMYGDGIFETMRVHQGRVINRDLHFERFFEGLRLLKFPHSEEMTETFLISKIQELLGKNNFSNEARVRLMAIRRNPLQDRNTGSFNYLLEAWPLEKTTDLNSQALTIGISRDAKKSCDRFSNLKSNNYLSSVMAMISAREMDVDECLILNSNNRICESAIANIFLVKEACIYTPPLSEGCVAGVVRRWLLENLPSAGFQLEEKEITEEDIMKADEIFLTNSIKPVRWVKALGKKEYENKITLRIAEFIEKHMF